MTYRLKANQLWGILLIGAILVLLSLFTPMAYLSDYSASYYVWMWALNIAEYAWGEINIGFIDDLTILVPSIICSVGILLSIIVLFSSVIKYKKSIENNQLPGKALLGASIAIIVFTVAWMVSQDVATSHHFWDMVSPHFGVFGLFIGSGISIIGYAYPRYINPERNLITTPKKNISTSIKLNFCPECGSQLVSETQKFCVNCGFHFRN